MNIRFSTRFTNSYLEAPKSIQKNVDKQLRLLEGNLRHPSLHAKKYDESRGIWQARVNRDWRMYFAIEKATYLMQDVMKHPK